MAVDLDANLVALYPMERSVIRKSAECYRMEHLYSQVAFHRPALIEMMLFYTKKKKLYKILYDMIVFRKLCILSFSIHVNSFKMRLKVIFIVNI